MEGCVSILQSIQTRSSPVVAELVDAVEVTGCKKTERNKLKTDDKSDSGAELKYSSWQENEKRKPHYDWFILKDYIQSNIMITCRSRTARCCGSDGL